MLLGKKIFARGRDGGGDACAQFINFAEAELGVGS
jgi:hypothetical protein